ncbi:hypothetical protein NL676_036897 [Syzygium grande]|nr:hypothetical protein NL676_036897 [Syzygium grande]
MKGKIGSVAGDVVRTRLSWADLGCSVCSTKHARSISRWCCQFSTVAETNLNDAQARLGPAVLAVCGHYCGARATITVAPNGPNVFSQLLRSDGVGAPVRLTDNGILLRLDDNEYCYLLFGVSSPSMQYCVPTSGDFLSRAIRIFNQRAFRCRLSSRPLTGYRSLLAVRLVGQRLLWVRLNSGWNANGDVSTPKRTRQRLAATTQYGFTQLQRMRAAVR